MIDTTALAAAVAAAPSLQGHILGELGASGAALGSTVILVLGCKGKHKIHFNQMQASIGGLITGTLYAAAAGIWAAPGTVTAGITQAVQGGVGGHVGLGAVAVCLTAILYGAKLKPGRAAVVGISASSVFALAGGIWALGSTVLASGLTQVLGA